MVSVTSMTSFSSGDVVAAAATSSVGEASERLKHFASASLGDYKNITWTMPKLKYGYVHVHVLSLSMDISLNFA